MDNRFNISTQKRNNDAVVNLGKIRKEYWPYLFVWVVHYSWVVVFTTWWTTSPLGDNAYISDFRSMIHIANLISSAAFIFLFKKDWFAFTARIGVAAIIITLGLYLIAPSPQVKALAAVVLGASLGCMNISILIPFTFVLIPRNFARLWQVICLVMVYLFFWTTVI